MQPAGNVPQQAAGATAHMDANPSTVALLGKYVSGTTVLTESGYGGNLTESNTCGKIASISPRSGRGPTLTVTVKSRTAGSCTITYADSAKHSIAIAVNVTTMWFTLRAASIPKGAKSIALALRSVDGRAPSAGLHSPKIADLGTCAKSCRIAGPQSPPGTDSFALTIFDGTGGIGKVLATGTVDATVVAGRPNYAAATVSNVPKYLVFGSLPAATAGTAMKAVLPLTVQDADHNTISGTYSEPIAISVSDSSVLSQGTSLSMNRGTASRSVTLGRSADVLTLHYGGLAQSSVSIAASATGTAGDRIAFAPALKPIAYAGPLSGSRAEIDLYNPAAGQSGYSASVSFSQPGWSGGIFENGFTYALGGAGNNCSSFVVSPSSGTATSYTVHVGSSPVAGTCMMTVTGGAHQTLNVILTYATTGIVIGKSHHNN